MSDLPFVNLNQPREQVAVRRGIHLVVALVLVLFLALLYFPLLFTNRVLAGGDILLYFYPYRDYAAAALRTGHIPLWNPYIFNGVPFLANPQAAVLYPFHWPLSWLPVTKQIYWSAAIHSWLLGYGGYLLMMRAQGKAWAGMATALVLAGSGFYGGLIGHINQMNSAAWLPWLLWTFLRLQTPATEAMSIPLHRAWRHRHEVLHTLLPASAFTVLFVALMLLAGHTQTAYINLFGVGTWLIMYALWQLPTYRPTTYHSLVQTFQSLVTTLWPTLLVYGVGVSVGVLLAAAQLLPSLELSELGLRSGGLSYADVSSFSLRPWRLPWALLPSYGFIDLGQIFGVGYTEFVAYVGLVGLLLGVIGAWRGRGVLHKLGIFFVLLGLFLAIGRWNPFYYLLYKLVPGFDLFRVPARWLMLYILGMAVLAGLGLTEVQQLYSAHRDRLFEGRRTATAIALIIVPLLGTELIIAAQALPHSQPTAPQAVYGVRTAPAHLLTDPQRQAGEPAAMGRFLGMSTITFDPGDMSDWRHVLLEEEPPQLNEQTFYDFIVALKVQELLVPNLPLLWRVPAVDGFDGGVLPLQRYNQLMPLFVPKAQLVPDGRLREQIREIPNAGLLGLLNIQYVITDKVRDLWFDGIYYDRQIGVQFSKNQSTTTIDVPNAFEATHLDLIGALAQTTAPISTADGQEATLAQIQLTDAEGTSMQLTLSALGEAGTIFAQPALDNASADEAGAVVALRDVEAGQQEYRARLQLPYPFVPAAITITHTTAAPEFVLQAATLYDERTNMFTSLLPSDRGRFRLVHSGDVKIYENLDVRPRAYLVHQLFTAQDADEAREAIQREETIQQGRAAVIETTDGAPISSQIDQENNHSSARDEVTMVTYTAEEITIAVNNTNAAFLVLSDSYYPGWEAIVNGAATPIYPTNVLFRGIAVPAGENVITFRYRPRSWQQGRLLAAGGLMLWGMMVLLSRKNWRRKR